MGTFIQALYDEAKNDGWTIISMKNRLETGIRLMSSDAPDRTAHRCSRPKGTRLR